MKKVLLLLFATFQFVAAFSQVSVRGYTRKDGTYVRPHTRSYPSDHSSSSSSSSSSSRYSSTGYNEIAVAEMNGEELKIPTSEFKNKIYKVDNQVSLYLANNYDNKAIPVYATSLKPALSKDGLKSNKVKVNGYRLELSSMVEDTTGFPVLLSVLRIDGKVVDICPLSRSSLRLETEVGQMIDHKFDKTLISAERAFELVDKYDFKISDGFLKKTYFSSGREKTPDYISRKIEVMKLK